MTIFFLLFFLFLFFFFSVRCVCVCVISRYIPNLYERNTSYMYLLRLRLELNEFFVPSFGDDSVVSLYE